MEVSNKTISDNKLIRVVLVDDHGLMRDALAVTLSDVPGIAVVGCARSGEDLLNQLDTFQPDIILMDIVMQGMSGIEATRWVKDRDSKIKIILLSGEIRKEFVTVGIQTGIDGYLSKDSDKEVLVNAIRSVSDGRKYFNEAITALVLDDFYRIHTNGRVQEDNKKLSDLTRRELEVLTLIASGRTTKEVADELFISVKTVETHKSNILDKLGLRNIAELVKYAIKNKLISDI